MRFPVSLPYSHDVYMAAMSGYNMDWIMAVGALFAVLAVSIVLLVRMPERLGNAHTRVLLLFLAVSAIMVGAGHQIAMMSDFNFLAPSYGAAWILHGALLLWFAIRPRGRMPVDTRAGLDGRGRGYRLFGAAIAGFGLFFYPVIVVVLAGASPASVPLAGSAPNATALAHMGFLLMMFPRPPVVLVLLPFAWAAVTLVSALLLDFPFDLLAAALLVVACVLAVQARFARVLPGNAS